MTKVKFLLSSISSGWPFWSVNHTSIPKNSEVNVSKKIKFIGTLSNELLNGLLGANIYKLLSLVDNHC